MATVSSHVSNRRNFLQSTAAAVLAGAAGSQFATAVERPKVTHPRATDGDDASEPNWKEKLTIEVGPQKGQIRGDNEKAIQAAVEYVARFGGGTVRILPGVYKMRNAVYLRSNVRIFGSGEDSVLIKEPSRKAKLSIDSDWYDQEITLQDPKGFQIGDGVCLRAKNPHRGGENVVKRTLIARSGNRFKLDRGLRKNFWLNSEAYAATLFPILSGENVENIVIENIVIDGRKADNERLDGNHSGCIFLQDCRRIAIREVEARNYHGDGISWQICHDVAVENCYSHDNTDLGLHPGSGSQRPVMRNNKLQRNSIGVFFCWGVKYGLAEKNACLENRNYGISIGHRDTNNLIRENEILHSGKVGVLFRRERGKGYAPHRNVLENNLIVDSGAADGVGVDVQGETESIIIRNNTIRETRQPMNRVGVRIGEKTRDIKLSDNSFSGLAVAVADMHKSSAQDK